MRYDSGWKPRPGHPSISTSPLRQRDQWEHWTSVQATRKSLWLHEALVQTKEPQSAWKTKGVVYQVPCAESETLEERWKKDRVSTEE